MRSGKVLLEIGFDQRLEVMNLINDSNLYEDVYCKKDLFGNDRVIVCNKR
ncbi:MAG: hypothetical protein HFJ51_06200 [Clostridia bacterium]|nr:hypothetical protein [Clostridia bacterium]